MGSLQAAPASEEELRVDPASLNVPQGQTAKAVVRVNLSGAKNAKLLELWANQGVMEKPTAKGDGRFEALWSMEGLGFPTVILMRADVEIAGRRLRRWLALPIAISMDMSVEVQPGDRVYIAIGTTDFGPVTAKTRGLVKIPVVVPPGAQNYTIHRTDDHGISKSESHPFELFPFTRMALAGPTSAAAGQEIEVEAYGVDSRGVPFAYNVAYGLSCEGAALEEIIGSSAVQRYRVRLSGKTGPVGCRVTLQNEPRIFASHTVEVTLSPSRRLALDVSPRALTMDSGTTALVLVTVSDAFGNPAQTGFLKVTANGSPVTMMPTDAGPYRGFVYAPTSRQPGDRILIEASAPGAKQVQQRIELQGTRATKVEARVHPREVQADGEKSVALEATATDRHSMPAGDQELRVKSKEGKLLFLHRVKPGLFRGRFLPHARPGGGEATIEVDAPLALRAEVSLRLTPMPPRLFVTPVVGAFADLLRTAGLGFSLRVEYGVYRGRPQVFVGGSLLLLPAFSVEEGEGAIVSHRGMAAGGVVHSRLRMVATRRFALDASFDLGVLGLYASFLQRLDTLEERHGRGLAVFTAAAGLEAAIVTLGQQEIFLSVTGRYLTGRFEDALSRNRVVMQGGLGYRFPL